jgi:hypothetical protein
VSRCFSQSALVKPTKKTSEFQRIYFVAEEFLPGCKESLGESLRLGSDQAVILTVCLQILHVAADDECVEEGLSCSLIQPQGPLIATSFEKKTRNFCLFDSAFKVRLYLSSRITVNKTQS